MKYFICSDIHGCYTKLINSLDKAGYDKNNKNHTLVVLGDLFDRGNENVSVFNFITSIPNDRIILVRGNHEYLLVDLINRGYYESHDLHNGTDKTVDEFLDASGYDNPTYDGWNDFFRTLPVWKFVTNRANWRNYFEVGPYIMTHGWIPLTYDDNDNIILDPNWRSDDANWYKSIWIKPQDAYRYNKNKLYPDDKIMICGHCPVQRVRDNDDTSIYKEDNLIMIDGGAPFGGIVNVLVIDDSDMTLKN